MGLKERLQQIEERIKRVCDSVARDPKEVTLIAVTKNASLDHVQEAYALGLRHFGESRLQDAKEKILTLPKDITWHFIGRLQTNKAKQIATLFQVIHSVESKEQMLEMAKARKVVEAFVQINLPKEPQKSGILPTALDALLLTAAQFKYLNVKGLMLIGPYCQNPEGVRSYFKELSQLVSKIPDQKCLSMGMSRDFEVALQEGATHIRIGSLLFGGKNEVLV